MRVASRNGHRRAWRVAATAAALPYRILFTMTNRITCSRPRRSPALALAVCLAGLAPAVLAQTAAPATSPGAAEETVTLSPFVIATERETGWSANDTLSATRTKQALKDVPVNIDAITSDFMEDLGLFTADDVTRFVANVYAAPNMENDNNTDNFSFRGLSQRFNVSRNYFRWYVPSDTYNVERIDFGKGSNSLIFGDVEPGGQGAVFTKRALFKNFGSVMALYGSEDAYRAQLDVNRRLANNLAVRFNLVRRAEKTFQDFSEYGFRGEHVALTWRPFKNTEIRVEAEQGEIKNQRGYGNIQIRELSARSRAFSDQGSWLTSDGDVFYQSSLSSADRSSSNGPGGGSISTIEGEPIDVVMRNAAGEVVGTKRILGYPKHYNIRGAFDQLGRPFDTYSITIEQRWGQLGLELAYNHQNQMALRNDNYFSQTVEVDVNGRPYIDSAGIDLKRFGNDVDAFRLTAVYPWKITSWMKQLVIATGDYREDFTNNYRYTLYNMATLNSGGTLSTSRDRIRFRAYLDDPRFYSKALFDQFTLGQLPHTATFDPQPYAYSAAGAGDATEWRQQSAAALSMSGNYFNGRLQSVFGVRHDWNKTLDYVGRRRLPTGEDIPPPNRDDALPGEYRENPNLNLSNTSYTGGLTVRLTKDINAYGVYSESFRFQDARTFDRKPFGPITGKTKEIGIKGDFWDRRATLQLGVFDIKRENVEFRWNPSSFSAGDAENLMNPNNVLPGDPRYLDSWDDVNQYRSVVSTETSKGFDVTLMIRPTKGLQTRFTIGKTDVVTRPDFSAFRAFYDAAVARGDESPALMAEAKDVLDSSDVEDKPTGARAAPWSVGWVVDYAFSKDFWRPLRGVRIGVNGNWRDNYLLAINNGVLMYGGQQHLVNAYVMRDQKLWGQQVRFRAGVRNLDDLENGETRRIGTSTLANGTPIYRVRYVMPPQYDASVTVKF